MSLMPATMILGPDNTSVAKPTPASQKNPMASSKLRSCVVCRSRKVRCDKLSPCSNCRRANIACVLPSADRPPRWARRLERANNGAGAPSSAEAPHGVEPDVDQVSERLRDLENLVEELRGQLEQANAAAAQFASGDSSSTNSLGRSPIDQTKTASTATSTTGAEQQFGRLVLQDVNRSRYVSGGFWSHANDEIDKLKVNTSDFPGWESDTLSADEDSPEKMSTNPELERTPSERHNFLFRHDLSRSNPDTRDFHPLPSQIPFLLDVYAENVHLFNRIMHLPSVVKMVRDLRGSAITSLTPANEALLFSIYYAAVASMEDDDIMNSFGCTKSDLSYRYRLGFEHALAKADFFNVPDIILVQALTIFLFLLRRHDSPRFVWMMTGLVIRMAQALGLHRDGSHFKHLTPYEVEIRRRVWWAVCLLDLRASEDQGTDLTSTSGFDTKLPLNINDTDIGPETKQTPSEHHSLTDMTFTLVSFEMTDVMRRLTAQAAGDGASSPENQRRLLNEIYERLDGLYLQYSTETNNIAYWVSVTLTRLVIAKMALLIYFPILFSSPSEHVSEEIRTNLLVSAIEVAEYNHALNSEKACRHWRWLFQTCTQWHAIVYLVIETSRRPWSPIVERAWVALHSSWLIPAQSKSENPLRILFPLRKLMAKAQKHREAELERLRGDTWSAAQLEMEDRRTPLPASSGPFPAGKSDDLFREHWRELVAMPKGAGNRTHPDKMPATGPVTLSNYVHAVHTNQQSYGAVPVYENGGLWSDPAFEPANLAVQDLLSTNSLLSSALVTNGHGQVPLDQSQDKTSSAHAIVPLDWSGGRSIGSDILPGLWDCANPPIDSFADTDVNMDLDTDVNWFEWIDSARSLEWDFGGDG